MIRLNLRTRLLAAFGVLLVLTLIVGWVGINQIGHVNDQASNMYADDLVGTGKAALLAEDISLARSSELAHIFSPNRAVKATLAAQIAQIDRAITTNVQAIRAGNKDGDLRAPLDRVLLAWDSYRQTRDDLTLPASSAGRTQLAFRSYNGQEAQRFANANTTIDTLIRSLENAARQTNAADAASFVNARAQIITVMVVSLLLGLCLALFLAHRIGSAVGQTARASRGLARGDLDQQIVVQSR
ncbi:MAG TPA: MCP four helix bundle domain-containing protein, partial [Chloroflexota bacterium]|nr:MCP four helix bundle domain-containing protein [Chloroflexota bacterium]